MSSSSPYQHQTEADSALWKISTVLANRDATTEQIMDALREWSRIVAARRDTANAPQIADPRPSSVERIVDVVSLSTTALGKQAPPRR